MQPYISLKIRNYIPHIVYHPDDGMSRQLTQKEESIFLHALNAARKFELIREDQQDDIELYSELLNLARESDESYVEELPELETEDIEFELEKLVNNFISKLNLEEPYADVDASQTVKDQLKRDQYADVFASFMDVIYMNLIGKTLVAASELGVLKISLDDEHKNTRLVEKMSRELEKMGVELIVE